MKGQEDPKGCGCLLWSPTAQCPATCKLCGPEVSVCLDHICGRPHRVITRSSETVSGRQSMGGLAKSGGSVEVLFSPASLSEFPAICPCFWVTEMFFHSPPPSFFCLALSAAPLYPSFPLPFPAQDWPLSLGKFSQKSNLLLQVAPPLPRPGFFPGCPAAGGLRKGGRGGLYGNPEKRMPSLLICI